MYNLQYSISIADTDIFLSVYYYLMLRKINVQCKINNTKLMDYIHKINRFV